MQFVLKLIVTVAVIVICAQIGRKWPSLGGLIATMPLTSLLVLLWLYSDQPGNFDLLKNYTKGVLWGIIPTVLFFVVAYMCFAKKLPFSLVLAASFLVWLLGAVVHQRLLK